MNPVDIFNHILSDRPKITYWMNRTLPKVEKIFAKMVLFPKYYSEEYKHTSSAAEYLLFYHQQNRNDKIQNKLIAKCCLENKKYYIEFGFGYNIDKENKRCLAAPVLNIYGGHFFERYKERRLKEESLQIEDVIGKYFTRLTRLNLLEINDDIIKDWKEKYGYFSTVFYTNEGICLGQRSICQPPDMPFEKGKANEVAVNEYKTFISTDMLSKTQKIAIKEEELKYYDRYVEHLNELHQIGAIK